MSVTPMAKHQSNSFVHLHNHFETSRLDGGIRLKDIAPRLQQIGQDAFAITDHGVLHGISAFYDHMKQHGFKPIIGIEAYVSDSIESRSQETQIYHLILLAQTNEGLVNLYKMSRISFFEGFYRKPRVDFNILRRHSEGLLCTTACLAGPLAKPFLEGDKKTGLSNLDSLQGIFGRRLLVELQDNRTEEQKIYNDFAMEQAVKRDLFLVLTNDSHFTVPDDYQPHQALVCLGTGKTLQDEKLELEYGPTFYVRETDDMIAVSESITGSADAATVTRRIADSCNVQLAYRDPTLPHYDLRQDADFEDYIASLQQAAS